MVKKTVTDSQRTLPLLIISLALFLGGIGLLVLQIPGWSIFLGLPSVQIGIIFLIFCFDDIARIKVGTQSCEMVNCSICNKPTLVLKGQKENICSQCLRRINKKQKESKAV